MEAIDEYIRLADAWGTALEAGAAGTRSLRAPLPHGRPGAAGPEFIRPRTERPDVRL